MVSLEKHLTLENSDFTFWLHKIFRRINMQIFYLYHIYKIKEPKKKEPLPEDPDKKKKEDSDDEPPEEEKKVKKLSPEE
jgi:hypothetical protein